MNFKQALFISFVSHCLILTPLGNLGIFFPNKKTNEPQVNYYKITPAKIEISKTINTKKNPEAPKPPETQKKQKPLRDSGPRRLKEKLQTLKKIKRPQQHIPDLKPQEVPLPKNENIIPASIPGTTLPNTPECVSYYQYIREEIRHFLKQNYTSAYEEGDIGISFVLNQTGGLVSIDIIDEKYSNDPELRRLSYESIKSSAPFKPFPKGLLQKQISFNLTVVFRHN